MNQRDMKRGEAMIRDIAAANTEKLMELGVAADQADHIGRQVADHVRHTYGGEQLYVPKGLYLAISERDREIWRKHNGGNVFALAKEYDLTERQIYAIVERVREEDFQRRQGRLF